MDQEDVDPRRPRLVPPLQARGGQAQQDEAKKWQGEVEDFRHAGGVRWLVAAAPLPYSAGLGNQET
jgi:hypothetical protein